MDKSGLMLKYFVLNPNKQDAYGRASRIALRAYADEIETVNEQFRDDIYNWLDALSKSGGQNEPDEKIG